MSSTINYSTLADQLAENGQQMNNNNGDSKEAMRKLFQFNTLMMTQMLQQQNIITEQNQTIQKLMVRDG